MFLPIPQATGLPFFRVLTPDELLKEKQATSARFSRAITVWSHGFLRNWKKVNSEHDVERWLSEQMPGDQMFYHIDWMRGVVLLSRDNDAFAFKMRWC